MRTSAGIPAFRSLEDAALAQWREEQTPAEKKRLKNQRLDFNVEKIWIAEDLPKSVLVVIRSAANLANPLPQFSFYRVDKSSLQAWHIEDDARRKRLLQESKTDLSQATAAVILAELSSEFKT